MLRDHKRIISEAEVPLLMPTSESAQPAVKVPRSRHLVWSITALFEKIDQEGTIGNNAATD